MKLGLVGLPNAGKSTLFNAVSRGGALTAAYPFTTIEPNQARVAVPDARLDFLKAVYSPERVVPASLELWDIAGLCRGASRGEGLGNKFLSHIREVDAIAHVVRCFDSGDAAHPEGGVDPARDAGIVNTELLLADLETLSRRAERAARAAKAGEKSAARELRLIERVSEALDGGVFARAIPLEAEDAEAVRAMNLLTSKKTLYVANASESSLGGAPDPRAEELKGLAAREGAGFALVSARIEEELIELPEAERAEFLRELGAAGAESGLSRLVGAGYGLLGRIRFYTGNASELHAWTAEEGTKAPRAAGKVHSDFERGFIRADVVSYGDLRRAGSLAACRERGLIRSEGREYAMRDGDVAQFKFNV